MKDEKPKPPYPLKGDALNRQTRVVGQPGGVRPITTRTGGTHAD